MKFVFLFVKEFRVLLYLCRSSKFLQRTSSWRWFDECRDYNQEPNAPYHNKTQMLLEWSAIRLTSTGCSRKLGGVVKSRYLMFTHYKCSIENSCSKKPLETWVMCRFFHNMFPILNTKVFKQITKNLARVSSIIKTAPLRLNTKLEF